jgi:hypothetical protein
MADAASVMGALRRFLPDFLRAHPVMDESRRRAVWALTHCRTAAMGGHVHVCEKCGTTHFAFHSCNHRSCPQCGKQDTAEWVERELGKRIGAPYFMVTFTLPQEFRPLFFTPSAKALYEVFFAGASEALSATLANPRWLGAQRCGFTMILHTWNQRLHFHPHIHCIVAGAGFDRDGRLARVKSPGFLVPQPVLRVAFRHHFAQRFHALRQGPGQASLPGVEPSVWEKDWGVHLQPFGDGKGIIQYLGRYVCRTAISDARMLRVGETTVTFAWKDRAHANAKRTETLSGVEFVSRYLRHVLPIGMRAIRRYGYCHPAAKIQRERLAFHSGLPLILGPEAPPTRACAPFCPCCKKEMMPITRLLALWRMGRDPPQKTPCPR